MNIENDVGMWLGPKKGAAPGIVRHETTSNVKVPRLANAANTCKRDG